MRMDRVTQSAILIRIFFLLVCARANLGAFVSFIASCLSFSRACMKEIIEKLSKKYKKPNKEPPTPEPFYRINSELAFFAK